MAGFMVYGSEAEAGEIARAQRAHVAAATDLCGKVAFHTVAYDGRLEDEPLCCQCGRGHNGPCQHIRGVGGVEIWEWEQGSMQAVRY